MWISVLLTSLIFFGFSQHIHSQDTNIKNKSTYFSNINKSQPNLKGNGFRYEVSFPSRVKTPPKETNAQFISQLNEDKHGLASNQINKIENTGKLAKQLVVPNDLDPNLYYGIPSVQQSKPYFAVRRPELPHDGGIQNYHNEGLNQKLTEEEQSKPTQNYVEESLFTTPLNPAISLDVNPEKESLLSSGSDTVEEVSPLLSMLSAGQGTEENAQVMEPETYSSVQFTGSVFTAEGLPAIGPEEELPVDYSFTYVIRGQPSLGHEESRVGDQSVAVGRYWATLPDGRVQEVRYTAGGDEGFRPTITYTLPPSPQ